MFDLLIVLAMLQVGDGLTTYYIITHGGRELNKIMAYLFSKCGMVPTLILKGVFVLAVGWACGQSSILALLIIIAMYIAVVGWNLYQIFKK